MRFQRPGKQKNGMPCGEMLRFPVGLVLRITSSARPVQRVYCTLTTLYSFTQVRGRSGSAAAAAAAEAAASTPCSRCALVLAQRARYLLHCTGATRTGALGHRLPRPQLSGLSRASRAAPSRRAGRRARRRRRRTWGWPCGAASREEEGDPGLVADLGGEVKQRRAALRDAVDVDDRLLQQHPERAHVPGLQRDLEGGA